MPGRSLVSCLSGCGILGPLPVGSAPASGAGPPHPFLAGCHFWKGCCYHSGGIFYQTNLEMELLLLN